MVVWCFECSIQICLADHIHLYTILFRHVNVSYCMIFLWSLQCSSTWLNVIHHYALLFCGTSCVSIVKRQSFHSCCWCENYIKGKASQPFPSFLASVHIIWTTSGHIIFNLSSISAFRLWTLLLQIWHAEEKMLCITGQRRSILMRLNKKVRKREVFRNNFHVDIYIGYMYVNLFCDPDLFQS